MIEDKPRLNECINYALSIAIKIYPISYKDIDSIKLIYFDYMALIQLIRYSNPSKDLDMDYLKYKAEQICLDYKPIDERSNGWCEMWFEPKQLKAFIKLCQEDHLGDPNFFERIIN